MQLSAHCARIKVPIQGLQKSKDAEGCCRCIQRGRNAIQDKNKGVLIWRRPCTRAHRVNIPNALSVSQAIQFLKSHSASKVFGEMPNFIKRYPGKNFWGGQPTGTSAGSVGQNIMQNYIRRQDASYEPFPPYKDGETNNCLLK